MRYFSKIISGVLLVLTVSFFASIRFANTRPLIVHAQEEICTGPFEPVSPALTDLGDDYYVRMDGQISVFQGGLYPGGSNQPPAELIAAGLAAAARIEPLDASGNPDPNGKIVMISVGMSNTSSEFGRFMELIHGDPEVNPNLFLVNGALGGQTADRWVDPQALTWQELDARLAHYHVSSQQVQVAWIKQTLTRGGDFPAKAQELQTALETIARNLKQRFPNLQIAFFSSRTRSYTYWRGLSPEPLAFETGFSVKWMIEKQINGDPALNFDPQLGEVKAPLLAWGPYLWADGLNPRSDGLVWTVEDLTRDCTHPTDRGKNKVANMLIEFYKTDPLAQGWFLADPFFLPTPGSISPTFQSVPANTAVVSQTPKPSATLNVLLSTLTPDLTFEEKTPDLAGTPEYREGTNPGIRTEQGIRSDESNHFEIWQIGLLAGALIGVSWLIYVFFSLSHKK